MLKVTTVLLRIGVWQNKTFLIRQCCCYLRRTATERGLKIFKDSSNPELFKNIMYNTKIFSGVKRRFDFMERNLIK